MLGSSNKILALWFCCFSLTSPSALWSVKWRQSGRNNHLALRKALPLRCEVPGELLQAGLRTAGSTRPWAVLETTGLPVSGCQGLVSGAGAFSPTQLWFWLLSWVCTSPFSDKKRLEGRREEKGSCPSPGSAVSTPTQAGLPVPLPVRTECWNKALRDGWRICR